MQPPPTEEIFSTTNGKPVRRGDLRGRFPSRGACGGNIYWRAWPLNPFRARLMAARDLLGRGSADMVTAVDRPLQSQCGENVTVDQLGKFLQLRQSERAQITAAFGGKAHSLRYGFMRFAKRHTLF